VLEKFGAMQMIDVHLPTTDGRELVLTRYTEAEAEPELSLLINKLKLELPANRRPKSLPHLPRRPAVVPTSGLGSSNFRYLGVRKCSNRRS
jgi:hypothetical protein